MISIRQCTDEERFLSLLWLMWTATAPIPRPGSVVPIMTVSRSQSASASSTAEQRFSTLSPTVYPSLIETHWNWIRMGLILAVVSSLVLLLFTPTRSSWSVTNMGSILLYCFSAYVWRFFSALLSLWVNHMISLSTEPLDNYSMTPVWPLQRVLQPLLRTGGPFGMGFFKCWESIVGVIWITYLVPWSTPGWPSRTASATGKENEEDHHYYYLTWLSSTFLWNLPLATWMWLVPLCGAVNRVLWMWSLWEARRTEGGRAPRRPTFFVQQAPAWEPMRLLLLAFVNALCEEVTSRGVWRLYMEQVLIMERKFVGHFDYDYALHASNLCQALLFGIRHYHHGIPSGCVGVALTTVYGIIMGLLVDYNRGLALAVIAHTIADYYIFASIARRQQQQQSDHRQYHHCRLNEK